MLGFPLAFRGVEDFFDPWQAVSHPAEHVRESPDALLIEFELPRYRQEDVTVTTDATGNVTVSGSRPDARPHHDASFGYFIAGGAQSTSFQRTFNVSPRFYDVARLTKTLDAGVLTITIPKVPQTPPPPALTVYKSHAAEGVVAKPMTREDFVAATSAPWPPASKLTETAGQLSYRFELPAHVGADNVELTLRGRTLVMSVAHKFEGKTARSTESRSSTYSMSMAMPEGTRPEAIHTAFADGALTITVDKAPAATGPAAQAVPVASPK